MTVAGLRRMLAALPPEFDDSPVMLQEGTGWTPAVAFFVDPHDEHNHGCPTVGFMPGMPGEDVKWFTLEMGQPGPARTHTPKRKDGGE